MKIWITLLLVTSLLINGQVVRAETSGNYALIRTRVSAGAATINGGAYSVTNVIALSEVGGTQHGGEYTLNSGAVDAGGSGPSTASKQHVFMPMIQR